jgi:hypothetical protein
MSVYGHEEEAVMKCEHCDSRATIHVTEMVQGIPEERHFCEEHAASSLADEWLHRLPLFPFAGMEEQPLERLMTAFEESDVCGMVGALIKLLKDDDHRVRYYAAAWLGQMGPDANEAIPHLRALLEDDDDHVRRAAEDALARIER